MNEGPYLPQLEEIPKWKHTFFICVNAGQAQSKTEDMNTAVLYLVELKLLFFQTFITSSVAMKSIIVCIVWLYVNNELNNCFSPVIKEENNIIKYCVWRTSILSIIRGYTLHHLYAICACRAGTVSKRGYYGIHLCSKFNILVTWTVVPLFEKLNYSNSYN